MAGGIHNNTAGNISLDIAVEESCDIHKYNAADFGNLSKDAILEIINNREAELLMPIIGFLSILLLTGICVNTIVIYIYKFKFKRSNPRSFILCLAILDMVTCCVGMPYHIVDMLYPYMFYEVVACKILTFFLTFTSLASTLVLVLIATERFLKICKPLEHQISDKGSKIACWIVVAVALLLAWPNAVVNGKSTVDFAVGGVIGISCFIDDDFKDTIYPLLYDSVLFLVFAGGTLTLLVLYAIVGRRILQHGTFRADAHQKELPEKRKSHCLVCSSLTTETSTEYETSESDETKEASKKCLPHNVNPRSPDKKRKTGMQRAMSAPSGNPEQKSSVMIRIRAFTINSIEHVESTLRRQRKQLGSVSSSNTMKYRRTKRITVMLLLITLVYVISFLPHLMLTVLASLDECFWENLPPTENVLCEFFYRLYFLNNVANFFIYGLWDAKFRRECQKLFLRTFNCGCSK